MRAESTHEAQPETTTPAEIPQGPKIVRYLIGGWNTAVGAILVLIGLGFADVMSTVIGAISIAIGVMMLVGSLWGYRIGFIFTLLGALAWLASGTAYGVSAALVQALMFLGILYARPAFGTR